MNPLDDGDWYLAYDGTGHPTIQVATISNLKSGLQYRYKFTAMNYIGESLNSTESTLLCASTPSAPGVPRLVNSDLSQITMTWDAPSQSGGALIESYEVWSKLADEADSEWLLVGSTDLNTLEFTHEIVQADIDVQYRVRAITDAGAGQFSIRTTFILADVPTITVGPLLVERSKSSIIVSWQIDTHGGSVITGYKLYQTNVTTGGEYLVYDGERIPTVTSTKIMDVFAGHSYKYRVKALNRVGESEYSDFSETIVAAYKPGRPDQPRFISATSTTITLEFDKVEDNGGATVSHYNLYYSEHLAETFSNVQMYDGFSLIWTIEQADESQFQTGLKYDFKVSAVNAIGDESDLSNSVTIAMAN